MRLPPRAARRRRRSAVAAVELALTLPLLTILLLGIWELGRAIQVYQVVSNAAREGARQAASAKYTKDEVRQAVFEYLQRANVQLSDTLPPASVTLANTNATIVVENLTTGGETLDANQLDRMQVTVAVPVRNFRWVLSELFLPGSGNVTAVAGFLCTKDVPIEVLTDIPQAPLPVN